MVRKAIQSYAKKGDRWKTIGGPISVLLIAKGGLSWIENEPSRQRWTYIQDLINDYKAGKTALHIIPPATREQLDNLLATVPDIE